MVQGKIRRVMRVVGEVVVAYDCYFECFTHVGVLVQHRLAFKPTSKFRVGYLNGFFNTSLRIDIPNCTTKGYFKQ